MNTEQNFERPTSKDFGFQVSRVDRERGHVYIEHSGRTYKWFLRQDDAAPILITGDERDLTQPIRDAMRSQVRAILESERRAS
jgi:hypothetical protein